MLFLIFRFSLGIFVLLIVWRARPSPTYFATGKIVIMGAACRQKCAPSLVHTQHSSAQFREHCNGKWLVDTRVLPASLAGYLRSRAAVLDRGQYSGKTTKTAVRLRLAVPRR
jgi:hypothetical protein